MKPLILFVAFSFCLVLGCTNSQPTSSTSQEIVTTSTTSDLELVNHPITTPKVNATKDSLISPIKKEVVKPSISNTTKPREVEQKTTRSSYPWMDNYNSQVALQNQIPTPSNYQRIPLEATSFGTWLRGLPLLPQQAKVMLYNGEQKPYQDGAHRVLNIDIGRRDLQQCADAVMRLVAEYHYSQKDYASIHFNYTSGHTIRFSDWSKGKKPVIKGSKVSFSSSNGSNNTSYKNFKKYLTNVYCYAGTASLSKELHSKKISDILPGDVFIWGGFPGHAVIVMDVAKHQTTGKKIFLLAQSYMPAQSIHILRNFNATALSPWYSEDFGAELLTPEWTFEKNTLKTFKTD